MLRKSLAFLVSIALMAAVVAGGRQSNAAPKQSETPSGDFLKIPVDDPDTKFVYGWLAKPKGAGPSPVVVLLAPCGGIFDVQVNMFARVTDDLRPKGIATLVVDSFSPRHVEGGGVCSNPSRFTEHRAAGDSYAAAKFLAAMPDIDKKHIFVEGFSHGAGAAMDAIDQMNADQQAVKFAGAIAYYPNCRLGILPSAPTLVLIGDKDDWTPASRCLALKDRPNIEIVVYPGVTHGFNQAGAKNSLGHNMIYDGAATDDAQKRTGAFIAEHLH